MRIKKTSQYIEGGANISNVYGTSQSNGYSQEYINGIIESGSNTNGDYTKFSDGTMICYKNVNFSSIAVTTASGVLYTTADSLDAGEFAQDFIGTPEISVTDIRNYSAMVGGVRYDTSTKKISIIMFTPKSWSSATFTFSIIAIGKWK